MILTIIFLWCFAAAVIAAAIQSTLKNNRP